MRRGEIWFAATPGGDRPVLVLTRDPVADRIGAEDPPGPSSACAGIGTPDTRVTDRSYAVVSRNA